MNPQMEGVEMKTQRRQYSVIMALCF